MYLTKFKLAIPHSAREGTVKKAWAKAARHLQNDYIGKEYVQIQMDIDTERKRIIEKVKENIVESMKIYKILQGFIHPRWYEFSKIVFY